MNVLLVSANALLSGKKWETPKDLGKIERIG